VKDQKKHFDRKDQFSEYAPIKKKKYGQHFLRKQSVVDHMIERVTINPETTVVEIGCGDGFLTSAILQQTSCKKLLVYEIDREWLNVVQERFRDNRLELHLKNILELDFEKELAPYAPLVLLANLPYQVTFPIIFLLQKYKHLFAEGVVMVQEEVAQKIVATGGRGYSSTTLFLQRHFDLMLMEKIGPDAFDPPPKVYSRLVYFKPKLDILSIRNEDAFWKFLKICFRSPRQTLRNNLRTAHYAYDKLPVTLLGLRGQQLTIDDFLKIWEIIDVSSF
jgi:16S rRNA (adenine1518-N6/adenine1519-N6)-dimethyltransferase